MDTKLLSILADGEWHSGQTLAERAGVSRTAIWNQVQKLQQIGIEIEAVTSRGYRINGGLDLLYREPLLQRLLPEVRDLIGDLCLESRIDSTNRLCLERLAQTTSGAVVVTAEQQFAGRGRRGRAWISPYARNIYLSIGWTMQSGANALQGLSLAAGVAAHRALKTFGVETMGLKWPNDLVVGRRKLGGILIELSGDIAGPCSVVLGLGLNVNMPAYAQSSIEQAWTDLYQQGMSASRAELLAALLNELVPMLSRWEHEQFDAWRSEWLELDAYAGKAVSIISGTSIVSGRACGVDSNGAIMIETPAGIQTFYGGEVSLRLTE